MLVMSKVARPIVEEQRKEKMFEEEICIEG